MTLAGLLVEPTLSHHTFTRNIMRRVSWASVSSSLYELCWHQIQVRDTKQRKQGFSSKLQCLHSFFWPSISTPNSVNSCQAVWPVAWSYHRLQSALVVLHPCKIRILHLCYCFSSPAPAFPSPRFAQHSRRVRTIDRYIPLLDVSLSLPLLISILISPYFLLLAVSYFGLVCLTSCLTSYLISLIFSLLLKFYCLVQLCLLVLSRSSALFDLHAPAAPSNLLCPLPGGLFFVQTSFSVYGARVTDEKHDHFLFFSFSVFFLHFFCLFFYFLSGVFLCSFDPLPVLRLRWRHVWPNMEGL